MYGFFSVWLNRMHLCKMSLNVCSNLNHLTYEKKNSNLCYDVQVNASKSVRQNDESSKIRV